jgi:predicted transcriptional regulator YheO
MELDLSTSQKGIIWNLIIEYENNSKFDKFVNSLSNVLKNESTDDDILTIGININTNRISKLDSKRLNMAIGDEVDNFFFTSL